MNDKKKKNTTDKTLTYSLPMKKLDSKTGADFAANRQFVQAMRKNNLSFSDINMSPKQGMNPSITVKNPDYVAPKKNKAKKKKTTKSEPIVGPVNKRKKKSTSTSLDGLF